jgi:hypothetical protein
VPEGGRHAPVLIATSWQALNRAISEGPETALCNCTVVILSAGFYVEANLNHVTEQLSLTSEMKSFLERRYPGLQDKMAWFYNEFVARSRASSRQRLFKSGIERKIRRRFPGFAKLYRFRNDLAHGVINSSATSLEKTLELREQAKQIVAELFIILERRGLQVSRDTTYYDALAQAGGTT